MTYIKKCFLKVESIKDIAPLFWNCMFVGFFLLPFGINLPTPFFSIAMGLGVLNIFISKEKISIKNHLPFLVYPVLYIIMIVSLVYTENTHVGLKIIERSVSLFFFPIAFIFLKEDHLIIKKIFHSLILGLVITFLYNFFMSVYNSFDVIEGELIFDSSVNKGFSVRESIVKGGNYFIGGYFSKLVHPSYVSLYVLMSLIYFVKNELSNKKRTFIIPIILIVYLFMLASRSAFLIAMIIILLFMFKSIKTKLVSGLVMISMIVFFLINPRFELIYKRLSNFDIEKEYKYTSSEQSRLLIWKSSIKLIKQSPFLGYGVGDANNELLLEYIDSNYITNIKYKYNAHNQYFQTLLQVGFLGLTFLIGPFFILAFRARHNLYLISVILILVFSLFFESMLVRYNGIIFFSIIVPLLLRQKRVII